MSTSSAWAAPEPTLVGRVVRLEPLGPADAEALWAAHDPGTTEHFLDPIRDRAGLDRFIAEALAARAAADALVWTIRRAADGATLGTSRLGALAPAHRRAEIGWTWLGAAGRGGAFNSEAKLLMLDHAFGAMGCLRAEFKTDARNARSQAALAAIGATREGVLRRHLVRADGSSRDSVYYAIVAEDWPRVRADLAARLQAKIIASKDAP